MGKKAQLWHIDLIIAIVIFTTALILFYSGRLNIERDTELLLDDLNREGNFIADSLMSEGFPKNWTVNDVIVIGIIDEEGRFDQSKINSLNSLGYNKTKSTFRTKYDSYLFFENMSSYPINMLPVLEGIGYPGINSGNINQTDTNNLIRLTRFGIYNSKPVRMVIYLWS